MAFAHQVYTEIAFCLANAFASTISAGGAKVTVTNSTVSGNTAGQDGGGIYIGPTTASLFNATITDNQADADFNGTGTGGGVYVDNGGTFNFRNSIVAPNYETLKLSSFWISTYCDCTGTITSNSNNILNKPAPVSIYSCSCVVRGHLRQDRRGIKA